jgi:ribonucleoside-diphosphate reductase beta chain
LTVLDLTNDDFLSKKLFLDGDIGITRFDKQKYPWIEKLTRQQIGFFWVPEEIELHRDQRDFKNLEEHERHIFTSNIKRQILLDSIQSRSPSLAFLPICSVPELENWITLWSFNESIHSRSYTHIIRNVYPDPSIIFDSLLDIKEIVDCAKDISEHYNKLLEFIKAEETVYEDERCSFHINNSYEYDFRKNFKQAIWLALMSVNILEGLRFYASFACSWGFGEVKKMEGNAKIIKLIARDENVHLAFTQQLLKTLPLDDPDFIKIKEETEQQCIDMFISCVDQEKAWAKYIFQYGSIIGLNEKLLCDYLEWLADKRMKAVGLKSPYKVSSNPLPWTQRWISSSEVQVAPQEVEVNSYINGGVKQDIQDSTFDGFQL